MAKVIFLHLFVILFTGGVCEADPPGSRPRGVDNPPPGADTPRTRHPPWQQTHLNPPTRHPPGPDPPGKQTQAYGQRAAGTHPTGMHSCL